MASMLARVVQHVAQHDYFTFMPEYYIETTVR